MRKRAKSLVTSLAHRKVLWRVSLPPTGPAESFEDAVWDWAGGQRWLGAESVDPGVWARAARAGGHATLFRGRSPDGQVFQPLEPGVLALHKRLKAALDPERIFNRGVMYEGL